jgi:hypothetical protein
MEQLMKHVQLNVHQCHFYLVLMEYATVWMKLITGIVQFRCVVRIYIKKFHYFYKLKLLALKKNYSLLCLTSNECINNLVCSAGSCSCEIDNYLNGSFCCMFKFIDYIFILKTFFSLAPQMNYNQSCFNTNECLTRFNLSCGNNLVCDCNIDKYWSITSNYCGMLTFLPRLSVCVCVFNRIN